MQMKTEQADPLVRLFNEQSDFPIEEDDVVSLYKYVEKTHPEIQEKDARIEKALEYIPVLAELKQEEKTQTKTENISPISTSTETPLQ